MAVDKSQPAAICSVGVLCIPAQKEQKQSFSDVVFQGEQWKWNFPCFHVCYLLWHIEPQIPLSHTANF